MELDARAGFSHEVLQALGRRPSLLHHAAQVVLEANFPASLHNDILDAVGFQWEVVEAPARARRDPAFRETILRIYERRCAMCGFDARLGDSAMGLEAAHVRWHSAGGPDEANNGLCLCTLHHKAFDSGALTIDESLSVHVSERLTGTGPVMGSLLQLAGQALQRPLPGNAPVHGDHARWHERQVFKSPRRGLGA